MTLSCRDTMVTLLGDVLPTMPLLLLATQEEEEEDYDDGEECAVPPGIFSRENGEIVKVEPPSSVDRKAYFAQVCYYFYQVIFLQC